MRMILDPRLKEEK
jgi:hypothetical protein